MIASVRRLWKSLYHSWTVAPRRPRSKRTRLAFDVLEGRVVPANTIVTITVMTDHSAGSASSVTGSDVTYAAPSLRAAVDFASSGGNGTLTAPDTTFKIGFSSNFTINLTNGTQTTTSPLTIERYATGDVTTITGPATIEGGSTTGSTSNAQIFYVDGKTADARFTDLNLNNGYGAGLSFGGAIANSGTLTLLDCNFSHDEAAIAGGAIATSGTGVSISGCTFSYDSAGDYGGAIVNGEGGTMTVTDSHFTYDDAGNSGGAIASGDTASIPGGAKVTLTTCFFTSNHATGYGGAIANSGLEGLGAATLTATDCTFGTNTAGTGSSTSGYGGAIFNYATGTGTAVCNVAGGSFSGNTVGYTSTSSGGEGGAIANFGTLDVTTTATGGKTSFSDNKAEFGNGGAIANLSLATVTIEKATFTSNTTSYNGGAIYNGFVEGGPGPTATATSGTLKLTDDVFTGNSANTGGALQTTGFHGYVTVTSSTFSHNSATGSGGAIYAFTGTISIVGDTSFTDNHAGGNAGAVFNYATMTVSGTTFSGNSAAYNGGALYNSNGSQLYLTDDALHGNTAGLYGGAVYNSATVTVTRGTINGHNAAYDGGGFYNISGSTLTLTDVVVTSNTATQFGGGVYTLDATLTPNPDSQVFGNIHTSPTVATDNIYPFTAPAVPPAPPPPPPASSYNLTSAGVLSQNGAQVDANVSSYQTDAAGALYELKTNGVLWELAGGTWTQLDMNVGSFGVNSSGLLEEVKTNGSLWLYDSGTWSQVAGDVSQAGIDDLGNVYYLTQAGQFYDWTAATGASQINQPNSTVINFRMGGTGNEQVYYEVNTSTTEDHVSILDWTDHGAANPYGINVSAALLAGVDGLIITTAESYQYGVATNGDLLIAGTTSGSGSKDLVIDYAPAAAGTGNAYVLFYAVNTSASHSPFEITDLVESADKKYLFVTGQGDVDAVNTYYFDRYLISSPSGTLPTQLFTVAASAASLSDLQVGGDDSGYVLEVTQAGPAVTSKTLLGAAVTATITSIVDSKVSLITATPYAVAPNGDVMVIETGGKLVEYNVATGSGGVVADSSGASQIGFSSNGEFFEAKTNGKFWETGYLSQNEWMELDSTGTQSFLIVPNGGVYEVKDNGNFWYYTGPSSTTSNLVGWTLISSNVGSAEAAQDGQIAFNAGGALWLLDPSLYNPNGSFLVQASGVLSYGISMADVLSYNGSAGLLLL